MIFQGVGLGHPAPPPPGYAHIMCWTKPFKSNYIYLILKVVQYINDSLTKNIKSETHNLCADPESVVRGGPTRSFFFFFIFFYLFSWWGEGGSKYHFKRAIIAINGVSLECRWWPYIESWFGTFVIFSGDPDLYWYKGNNLRHSIDVVNT